MNHRVGNNLMLDAMGNVATLIIFVFVHIVLFSLSIGLLTHGRYEVAIIFYAVGFVVSTFFCFCSMYRLNPRVHLSEESSVEVIESFYRTLGMDSTGNMPPSNGTSDLTPEMIELENIERDFDEEDYESLLMLEEALSIREGLSVAEINTITNYAFTQSDTGGNGSANEIRDCLICLQEFRTGERIRILPCGHDFHMTCIDNWLIRKATCPVCKDVL